MYSKSRDSETITNLESKLNQLKDSYDILKAESKVAKTNEEKQKYEILNLKAERDKYEEKYIRNKNSKDELLKRVASLESQVKNLNYEKEFAMMERKRQEDEKRNKYELKAQCIEQMKSSISSFKAELIRSRSKNK